MAGAGFKDFVAGDVLTADQVDTFLMQQSVMRFANAAARTAAIASPSEGMMSTLDDTNAVERYSGATWIAIAAGATGGGTNQVFYENDVAVSANYTISTSKNAMTAGPVTVNAGVTVTIPTGSVWSIV